MYYNMVINNDLIRLAQLEQALHSLSSKSDRGFAASYDALLNNLRIEIAELSKNIDLTAVALLNRNGTLNPM